MSLDQLKEGAIALVFLALIVGASALALDSFQGDLDSDLACVDDTATFNETSRTCYGGTTTNTTTSAFNITQSGLEGTANSTGYLDTIGTLLGVAALIAVVVGAFLFVQR